MLKIILPVAVVLIIIVAVIGRFTIFKPVEPTDSQLQPREVPLDVPETGQFTNEVNSILEQANKPVSAAVEDDVESAKVQDLTNRIRVLETAIQDLRAQVKALTPSSGATTTTSGSTSTSTAVTPPTYIPLPFNGQITSLNSYQTIPGQTITLNPAQYPGYSSMVLLVQLQSYQGNGTAYASLVNTSTGNTVAGSEVSTGNYYFTNVTSGAFTLPAGSANYGMQLKSNTGYAAIVQSAMLIVQY